MNLNIDMTSISIVIPVYNSEDSIGKLVDELVLKLNHLYDLLIVLVNDNSQDKSEEILRHTTRRINPEKTKQHSKNGLHTYRCPHRSSANTQRQANRGFQSSHS